MAADNTLSGMSGLGGCATGGTYTASNTVAPDWMHQQRLMEEQVKYQLMPTSFFGFSAESLGSLRVEAEKKPNKKLLLTEVR